MNVLVVGATGSIGRLVVEEAVRKGQTVRALVRDPRKARQLLPEVQVVAGDLTRPDTLGAEELADPVAEPSRPAVAVKEAIERVALRRAWVGEAVHQMHIVSAITHESCRNRSPASSSPRDIELPKSRHFQRKNP
jgi:nucleoside-diphosphate-sugar epimerase